MKNLSKAIYIILLVAAVFVGYNIPRKDTRSHINHTVTVIDTVRDTITIAKPKAVYSKVFRIDTVHLTTVDTISNTDSVFVPVPIDRMVYTDDSTYTAIVSGYRASLDSISVYNKTITKELVKKPPRISISLQAGYGFTSKTPSPYIGLGVSYNIFNLK